MPRVLCPAFRDPVAIVDMDNRHDDDLPAGTQRTLSSPLSIVLDTRCMVRIPGSDLRIRASKAPSPDPLVRHIAPAPAKQRQIRTLANGGQSV